MKSWISLFSLWVFLIPSTGMTQVHEWDIQWIKPKSNQIFQETIYAIAQDSTGFIWFGTENDLVRYDGYDYRIYHFTGGLPPSIQFSMYTTLLVDHDGFLWIGSSQDGLSRFDPIHEKFDYFFKKSLPDNRILSDQIKALYQSQSGSIWVATTLGLHQLDLGADETWEIQTFRHDPENEMTLSSDTITSLGEDAEGNLWVGTPHGLNKMNPSMRSFTRFFHDSKQASALSSNVITSLCLDHKKRLWIGTRDGLNLWDKRTEAFVKYVHDPHDSSSLSNNHLTDIQVDHQGKLWIATYGGGLNQLNVETGFFTHFQAGKRTEPALQDNHLLSVLVDDKDRIWVGGSGLNFLFESKKKIHFFDLYRIANHRKPNFQVRTFYQDSINHLWIGTTQGLFELNWNPSEEYPKPQADIVEDYFYPNPSTPGQSVNHQRIQYIEADHKGNLWLGTFGGLNIYDGKQFYYHNPDPQDSTRISGRAVSKILQQNDTTFWIGTWDNGLNKAIVRNPDDLKNGIYFQQYLPDSNNLSSLNDRMIRDLLLDQEETLWIATQGGGVNFLDLKTETFTNTIDQSTDPTRLFTRTVLALARDSKGSMWAAGHGLTKWEASRDQMSNFSSPDLYYAFYTLAIDHHDHLWSLTPGYILQYDPTEDRFTAYDEDDGITDQGGYGGSQYQNEEGWILFGRENGFDYFHPDSLLPDRESSIPILTKLSILHQEIGTREKDSKGQIILPQSITFLPSITLRHDQNVFAITFAAIGSTYPQSQRFAYQLEGLEGAADNWVEVGPNNREASFSGLTSGSYTFRVKVANHDQVWNDKPRELIIHILPPWWQTWWAYALYGFTILGILIGIFRAYLLRERMNNQLKLQQAEANSLRQLDKLKSQFFANISHEFRTPLTLILAPVKQLIEDHLEDTDQEKLSLIQRNAQRLQALINQILDINQMEANKMSMQAEPGDLVQHVRVLCSSFHSLAEEKDISFRTSFPESSIILNYDRDKVEKIIMNLLSNAFKFTPTQGEVELCLILQAEKEVHRAVIEVSDTGMGIPTQQLPHVFDRFVQGDESSTRKYEGSGIGLALTKELVELMGGDIEVDSSPSIGTCFTVSLLLESSHDKAQAIVVNVPHLERPSSIPSEIAQQTSTDQPILLIVEDNPDMRRFLKSSLQDTYQILTAEHGKQGLDIAQARIPDLIISDVMMPEMDGFGFCQAIKNLETTSHIPTILLTARAGIDSRVEGFEQGADGYLTKPFEARELKAMVKSFILQRKLLRETFSRSIRLEPKGMAISSLDEQFLIKVQDFLESNFQNPKLSVEGFAQSIGVSRMQLHRKLKALTDQSAGDMIRQFRLGKSQDLLKKSGLPIAEIAYQCGFEDPAYFSKVFKQQFDLSPSAFKKSQA